MDELSEWPGGIVVTPIMPINLGQFEDFLEEERITKLALFENKRDSSVIYAAHFAEGYWQSFDFADGVTKKQVIAVLEKKGILFDYGIDTD